ncbi:uncharacterized protein K460DRAFT_274038 [Cucurbitaria berberidis CBS 394.84]|uniref:Uncharacterized protein n=1 Tax=Cucurbitaria berberidis CBS 394.84 TaxID=1168544 RepID=A0A9P4GT85_9PLEO|nr:uncharacterized protein K460DRAFT_274038 [Cucurbitaria berberidis CBS 394.84]KAF1851056.1 hypothetical protein K460DRAFT_274038 [Cucurbitaria berberidis CBS 394.84]
MRSTDIDLSQYTESIFIPFIHKLSTEEAPRVMCRIEGVDIRMPVDTGSTCLLIGAPILPNISATVGTPAHHYFTSSLILYVGRLVELPIGFHGEAGSYATTIVPVLIVDKSWRCPWYNPSKDGFTCPLGPEGEKAVERDTSSITYMGVGFGRNQPRDGMPNGTPKVNPFLNVIAINGQPISTVSMRAGYVVSADGVHLGLTKENTRGFAFDGLEPGLAHAEDPRDWAMAKMCFSIDGEGANCGPILIDTGIPQMYIRAEAGVSIPTVLIRNPNKRGHAKLVKRVKPGTCIAVNFPSLGAPVVSYSFVLGEGSCIEPSYVVPAKHASPPYINTGRNFILGYSTAFDAIGGRFGLRSVSNPSSSSLL